MKPIKSGIFAFLVIFSINAQASTSWKFDRALSPVNFSVNHFFSAVAGKFTNFDGSFNFDPVILNESNANFTIAVISVSTDDSKRHKHLQSADFFDANSYPANNFISTRFEKKSEKDYVVYGKLSIRDITKDISLPFKATGQMEHPMMKGIIIFG